MSGRSAKRALCAPGGIDLIDCVVMSGHPPLGLLPRTERRDGRAKLSVYRHGVACALFFANAILNVLPNLVWQSSILLLDRRSRAVEPCAAHRGVAIDARDAGTAFVITSSPPQKKKSRANC
jgi:hypothetical protein